MGRVALLEESSKRPCLLREHQLDHWCSSDGSGISSAYSGPEESQKQNTDVHEELFPNRRGVSQWQDALSKQVKTIHLSTALSGAPALTGALPNDSFLATI